jgi:hypothetical protein
MEDVKSLMDEIYKLRSNVNPHTLRRMILCGEISWGCGIPSWPEITFEETLHWATPTIKMLAKLLE